MGHWSQLRGSLRTAVGEAGSWLGQQGRLAAGQGSSAGWQLAGAAGEAGSWLGQQGRLLVEAAASGVAGGSGFREYSNY